MDYMGNYLRHVFKNDSCKIMCMLQIQKYTLVCSLFQVLLLKQVQYMYIFSWSQSIHADSEIVWFVGVTLENKDFIAGNALQTVILFITTC